jgi:hypothetical protein
VVLQLRGELLPRFTTLAFSFLLPFELNHPGQRRFIPVVRKNEGEGPNGLQVLFQQGTFARPSELPNGDHILTFEARAAECDPVQILLRVRTDEEGKLRTEQIN